MEGASIHKEDEKTHVPFISYEARVALCKPISPWKVKTVEPFRELVPQLQCSVQGAGDGFES
jgi:hypothetical protein